MLRLFKIVLLIVATMPSLSLATAHELICAEGSCFPGDFRPGYPGRAHNFHPHLRDGVPLVGDFQDYPAGYHGVGCVWSRVLTATQKGLVWAMAPFCLRY